MNEREKRCGSCDWRPKRFIAEVERREIVGERELEVVLLLRSGGAGWGSKGSVVGKGSSGSPLGPATGYESSPGVADYGEIDNTDSRERVSSSEAFFLRWNEPG